VGFRVWGLGFGVWGLGFGVWGLGFRTEAAVRFAHRMGNPANLVVDMKLLALSHKIWCYQNDEKSTPQGFSANSSTFEANTISQLESGRARTRLSRSRGNNLKGFKNSFPKSQMLCQHLAVTVLFAQSLLDNGPGRRRGTRG